MLKVSRSKIPLTLSGLNLIWNTLINFFFSEKFLNRIEYPNFFKFKKKFFSNIFDFSILNLCSLFFLYELKTFFKFDDETKSAFMELYDKVDVDFQMIDKEADSW